MKILNHYLSLALLFEIKGLVIKCCHYINSTVLSYKDKSLSHIVIIPGVNRQICPQYYAVVILR